MLPLFCFKLRIKSKIKKKDVERFCGMFVFNIQEYKISNIFLLRYSLFGVRDTLLNLDYAIEIKDTNTKIRMSNV